VDPDGVMRHSKELDQVVSVAAVLGLPEVQLCNLPDEARLLLNSAKQIEQVIVFGRRLARGFAADPMMTPDAIRKLLAGARHAASLAKDLAPMRHPALSDETASHVLMEARERASSLQRKMAPLVEQFTFTVDGQAQQWRVHAKALRSSRFPSVLWRKDVRAAKARYEELLRAPRKVRRHEMASHFEKIAECDELALSLTADTTLKTVCGPHFQGPETPFDQLIQVSSYMVSVKNVFSGQDGIDARARRRLLEGSSATLAEIASLGQDPEASQIEEALADFANAQEDLIAYHGDMSQRAEKIARVAERTLALGLNPELRVGSLAHLSEIAVSWLEADAAMEANSDARGLLRGFWSGAESRPVIMNALHAASAVERANLPESISKYLFHSERDSRISILKILRADLEFAGKQTSERWRNVAKLGQIDENAFFGLPFDRSSLLTSERRIERALAVPDQLSVWTNWLVARQECIENGLSGIIEGFANEGLEANRLSQALSRLYWRTLARSALAEHPILGRFRGLQLQSARERFCHLDEEIIELQRKALAAELCRRPIDPGYRSDYRKGDTGLVLVRHEIGKQRRHIPIRELLARAGRSIRQMKPCFMMSPLSVA
jgi:hypothetical protein